MSVTMGVTEQASIKRTLAEVEQLLHIDTPNSLLFSNPLFIAESVLTELACDPRIGVAKFLKRYHRKVEDREQEQIRLEQLTREERTLWREGIEFVAGVDEVGAGPLAGPVVAAAVILHPEDLFFAIDDSKKLSAATRQQLEPIIKKRAAAYAIGQCSALEVDQLNIRQASLEAMRRAVNKLSITPEFLLVDAHTLQGISCAQKGIIGGDGKSQTIAAASILAKEERDRLMTNYAQQYPGYGFEKHSGYGTVEHMNALNKLGPCAIHRKSFKPVAALMTSAKSEQQSLF